jgi:hypothetical protein
MGFLYTCFGVFELPLLPLANCQELLYPETTRAKKSGEVGIVFLVLSGFLVRRIRHGLFVEAFLWCF